MRGLGHRLGRYHEHEPGVTSPGYELKMSSLLLYKFELAKLYPKMSANLSPSS